MYMYIYIYIYIEKKNYFMKYSHFFFLDNSKTNCELHCNY